MERSVGKRREVVSWAHEWHFDMLSNFMVLTFETGIFPLTVVIFVTLQEIRNRKKIVKAFLTFCCIFLPRSLYFSTLESCCVQNCPSLILCFLVK